MLPYLTGRGQWVLCVGIVFIISAVLATEPLFVFLAVVPILLLVIALVSLLPAVSSLENRRVFLSVSQLPGGIDGQIFEPKHTDIIVHCAHAGGRFCLNIHNPTSSALVITNLSAYASAALNISECTITYRVSAGEVVGVNIHFHPNRIGRWAIQGFNVIVQDRLGIFYYQDYLPSNVIVECYPKKSQRALPGRCRALIAANDGVAMHTTTAPARSQSTSGLFNELRPYRYGDRIQQIAWKATLRTQKLIVKEDEHLNYYNSLVLLDVASSMRTGAGYPMKWELAYAEAFHRIDQAHQSDEGIGLLVFSEDIEFFAHPHQGRRHAEMLRQKLIGFNAPWRPNLTEFDDDEMTDFLLNYLLIHERLDFRRFHDEGSSSTTSTLAGLTTTYAAALIPWLKRRIKRESTRLTRGYGSLAAQKPEAELSLMREFLRMRSVDIPARVETRFGRRDRYIASAIDYASRCTSERQHIVVLSDMYGIQDYDYLRQAVTQCHRRGHTIEFLVPYGQSGNVNDNRHDEFKQTIRDIFDLAQYREVIQMIGTLQSAGLSVRLLSSTKSPNG